MKKLPAFLIFSFVFFFIFACDLNLQWPKEIEIKKQTPELRFNADIDELELKDFFGNIEEYNSGANAKVIDCKNTEIFTKLIYVEAYNDKLTLPSDIETAINFAKETGETSFLVLPCFSALLPNSSEITIPALNLSGTDLKDFSMEPLTARIYISGEANSSFLNALAVKIKINNDEKTLGRSSSSGFASVDKYSGTSLPGTGNDITLSLDEEVKISFSISLREGAIVDISAFDDDNSLDVLVELAIWLPFVLVAEKDTKISLPFDDLFSDDDLFGRESADDESFLEYVDSIYLEIVLNKNPFSGSTFVVTNETITETTIIKSPITGNAFRIEIAKDDIGFPFTPSFSVSFVKGGKIIIPRVLKVEEFAFKAKLKIVVDFPQISGGWPWT